MLNISDNSKLHLAQILTFGEVCYYDKETKAIIAASELEGRLTDKERAKRKMEVTQNSDRYIQFDPPVDSEKLLIVQAFAQTVRDKKEREHLVYAMQRPNAMAVIRPSAISLSSSCFRL